MSEIEAVQAVQSAHRGEDASSSSSLAAYQRWLADSGNMPIGSVLTQHPSRIAAAAMDQAGGVTNSWNRHLNLTAELFSDKKIDSLVNELRHGDTKPGPASAPLTPSSGEPASTVGSDHPPSLEEVKKAASDGIMDATARSIEMQWRQSAALIEHDLSNQILTSTMQSSISAGKEINEGLDSLLRG